MTGHLSDDELRAVARLYAVLELLPRELDRAMHPAGITSFEYTLLEALSRAEDHRLRLTWLAARTNATLARLSRVVTSLERKGMVQRVPCPVDARATNAVLTEAGVAAARDGASLYAEAVRTLVLGALGPQDVSELGRICLAILSRLDPEHRLDITREDCDADEECQSASMSSSCEESTIRYE